MRYILRKQEKIQNELGKEYLENHLLVSLNRYFENVTNKRIFEDIESEGYVSKIGNKYPLLRVNDISNENAMLEFVIIGKTYDILRLSYVGRMKG